MQYGIRVGMLRTSFETAHEEAGKLGFDGVELEVGPKAAQEGSPLFDAAQRDALKKRMAACGVVTSCVCVGGFWQYGPASAEEALRDTGKDILRKTIEACAAIGTGYILTPLNNSGQAPEVATARWLEFLQELKADAEAHKVMVCLEPCARPGMGTDAEVKALVDRTGSPYVRAYFDVSNMHAAGTDPVTGLKALGSAYVGHIHMKDRKPNPPGSERPFSTVALGEGILDFPGIAAAIREIGYDGWLTLETPTGDDPKPSARKDLAFMKALF
ncbi:MAG: sugar phosphate isomerase/epimerase [Kiritimatiellae bacterium]|nr:sugar phosphate isomerase/epimerase [Kiritimatiellia bacterium]